MRNSVTLSTMHGCPPDEIERIARYMLEERKLHTMVKMNPTLLGKEGVLDILHTSLGFTDIDIPDSVFEHDLAYPKALELIRSLQGVAAGSEPGLRRQAEQHAGHGQSQEGDARRRDVHVGPCALPGHHEPVQQAGARVQREPARLLLCWRGRAEHRHHPDVRRGARHRLLRPAETGRLCSLRPVADEPGGRDGSGGRGEPGRVLGEQAGEREGGRGHALVDHRYKKEDFPYGLPKIKDAGVVRLRPAPCMARCAVCQDVPEYAWRSRRATTTRRWKSSWRAIRCPASPAMSATTCARPAARGTTTRRPSPSAR